MSFAVIDFETTGLRPEGHDRVVEVAAVLLNGRGETEWEWTSLINPRRDMGATRIHGITARDVADAPEFADIADPLLDAMRGRTVVAHNAPFDMRFLHHELRRSGYPVGSQPRALCSMKWAGRYVGAAKLAHCCEAIGIELDSAHSALGDARATAQLIGWLAHRAGSDLEWAADMTQAAAFEWPNTRVPGQAPATTPRVEREPASEHSWLDTILANTWVEGNSEAEASYLVTLDSALLDRSISTSEGGQLIEAAQASGITAQRALELHRDHLAFLAAEAWSDGVLTAEEESDLAQVTHALRLTAADLESALSAAEAGQHRGEHIGAGASFLQTGDRVVFTGEMNKSRDEWVEAIVDAGLSSGGVTKSTRVLVTSDPDSMSGKAAKARKYGIPVIDEPAFDRMFVDYLRNVNDREAEGCGSVVGDDGGVRGNR